MAAPLRCPACDEVTPAAPDPSGRPVACPGCGRFLDFPPSDDSLPLADDIPGRAVPTPVARPGRRRRPPPDLSKGEYQAARLLRWGIIVVGLLLVGSCVLVGVVGGPAVQRNGGPNPAGRPPR